MKIKIRPVTEEEIEHWSTFRKNFVIGLVQGQIISLPILGGYFILHHNWFVVLVSIILFLMSYSITGTPMYQFLKESIDNDLKQS